MIYKYLGTHYEVIEGDFTLNEFSESDTMHRFLLGTETIVATFKCGKCVEDESRYAGPVILYHGLDGSYWLRPPFEFFDGRFEQVKIEHS